MKHQIQLSLLALAAMASPTLSLAASITCPPKWDGVALIKQTFETKAGGFGKKDQDGLICSYGQSPTPTENPIEMDFYDCRASNIANQDWTYLETQLVDDQIQTVQKTIAIDRSGSGQFLPKLSLHQQKDTFECLMYFEVKELNLKRRGGELPSMIAEIPGIEKSIPKYKQPEQISKNIPINKDELTRQGYHVQTFGDTTYYYLPEEHERGGSIMQNSQTGEVKYVYKKTVSVPEKKNIEYFKARMLFTNQVEFLTN